MPATSRLVMFAALAVTAIGGGCQSAPPPNTRQVSRSLGDDLMVQLEQRSDVRHVRLAVPPFGPRRAQVAFKVEDGAICYDDLTRNHGVVERVRQQIISDLAQKVRIVETDTPPESLSDEVTAVLLGHVSWDPEAGIRVRTRIVDRHSQEILAVADGVLP